MFRDGYLAFSDETLESLEIILTELSNIASEIEIIRVKSVFKKYSLRRIYESDLQAVTEKFSAQVGIELKLKANTDDFHDRQIFATVVGEDGVSECWAYELSGGVDRLLREKYESSVTVYRIDEFGSA